jgi:hypothetical protein
MKGTQLKLRSAMKLFTKLTTMDPEGILILALMYQFIKIGMVKKSFGFGF